MEEDIIFNRGDDRIHVAETSRLYTQAEMDKALKAQRLSIAKSLKTRVRAGVSPEGIYVLAVELEK